MSLETLQLDKKMLEYSISEFRNIPEYVKICEAFSVGAYTIQDTINYLTDMIDKDKAEGVWLDYIGWLVGAFREEYINTADFFCVNTDDVNRLKRFYFPSISSNLGLTTNLSDSLYNGEINAKIGYNVSNGTREDNIRIIKPLVNADKVIITNYAPMELEITIYGNNILTQNIKSRIESVLAPGVSVHGDIVIHDYMSQEEIEKQINLIVEMTNISEIDPNYDILDVNDDLNYILEIE